MAFLRVSPLILEPKSYRVSLLILAFHFFRTRFQSHIWNAELSMSFHHQSLLIVLVMNLCWAAYPINRR